MRTATRSDCLWCDDNVGPCDKHETRDGLLRRIEVMRADRHARDMRVAEATLKAAAVSGRNAVRHSQQTTDQCRDDVERAILGTTLAAVVEGVE